MKESRLVSIYHSYFIIHTSYCAIVTCHFFSQTLPEYLPGALQIFRLRWNRPSQPRGKEHGSVRSDRPQGWSPVPLLWLHPVCTNALNVPHKACPFRLSHRKLVGRVSFLEGSAPQVLPHGIAWNFISRAFPRTFACCVDLRLSYSNYFKKCKSTVHRFLICRRALQVRILVLIDACRPERRRHTVFYFHQAKPRRRRGGPGSSPVSRLEDFENILRSELHSADLDQCTHDITNHVMKKAAAPNFVNQA